MLRDEDDKIIPLPYILGQMCFERGQAIFVIKQDPPAGAQSRTNKLKSVVFMEEACLWLR